MKILSWMHSKFQQKSNEPFKNFTIGNPCGCLTGKPLNDELQNPTVYNNCMKPIIKGHKDNNFKNQNNSRTRNDDENERSKAAFSEMFLAIGTLGSGIEPSKFSISVDKETQVTEDELKLINEELDKVLGNDDDNCIINIVVSSRRNSHVSSNRESTEKKKKKEMDDIIDCSLQSYLLGKAMMGYEETKKTSFSSDGRKKDNRASLGELFLDETMEIEGFKSGIDEKKTENKSVAFLLKKMLKRHASTMNANKKLQKILQILKKKVHPENSMAAKKSMKTRLHGNGMADKNAGPLEPSVPEEEEEEGESRGVGSRERWIKSDSDFLVLEL